MSNYQSRKEKELQFLNLFINGNEIANKNELVTKIKSSQLLKNDIPLSNYRNKIFYFGKNELDYTYLRFKHEYTIRNEERLINLNYSDNYHHKTIYFNSGMSAITTIIDSIIEIHKFSIRYSKDIYFETYKLLCEKNMPNRRKYFAFYDAIEPKFNINTILDIDISKKNCQGIIIDTTCLREIDIEDLINECIEKNKFIFLVKSLTKLDMLGTEYSRLGCLTMIISQKISQKELDIYQNLYVKIKQKNINYSSCPLPIDFPPFWDYNDFFELNDIRISEIKLNNRLVYENIKNYSKFSVVKPNHELFLLIYLNNDFCGDHLIKICKKIETILNKFFDIRYCGSFGFDFISLDTYINVSDNKETIRLSLNDCDQETAQLFSLKFLEAINDCI